MAGTAAAEITPELPPPEAVVVPEATLAPAKAEADASADWIVRAA